MSNADRRKHARLSVRLPVRVRGWDADGTEWEEMSATDDLSAGGLAFGLDHAVSPGHLLHLILPLPERYRRYDLTATSYRIYCLVRCIKRGAGKQSVGVMFLGKERPKSADASKRAVFLLPGEKRRDPRIGVKLKVILRAEDAPGGKELQEIAVTENLSKRGAMIKTGLPLAKRQMVDVEETGGAFKSRADVRNVTIGDDGLPRLHLLFLDATVPDELIEKT